jgi:hypothetical protein
MANRNSFSSPLRLRNYRPRGGILPTFDLSFPFLDDGLGLTPLSSFCSSVNVDAEVGTSDAVVRRLAWARINELERHRWA